MLCTLVFARWCALAGTVLAPSVPVAVIGLAACKADALDIIHARSPAMSRLASVAAEPLDAHVAAAELLAALFAFTVDKLSLVPMKAGVLARFHEFEIGYVVVERVAILVMDEQRRRRDWAVLAFPNRSMQRIAVRPIIDPAVPVLVPRIPVILDAFENDCLAHGLNILP